MDLIIDIHLPLLPPPHLFPKEGLEGVGFGDCFTFLVMDRYIILRLRIVHTLPNSIVDTLPTFGFSSRFSSLSTIYEYDTILRFTIYEMISLLRFHDLFWLDDVD
jgi:hypothetical protein